MVYRETTNPPVATGDGMAAAYRAGAALRDMEFMQFHPTVLYVAGSSRYLISEAVRGEGAYLRDLQRRALHARRRPAGRTGAARRRRPRHLPHHGADAAPQRLPRPVAPRPAMVRHRFPGINRVCRGFGLDITRDRIPVRPGAHYMIGGVTVDAEGRTTAARDSGRAAKSPPAVCTAPTASPRTASSKGSSTARCADEARANRPKDRPATCRHCPSARSFQPPDGNDRLDVADLTASLRASWCEDGDCSRTHAVCWRRSRIWASGVAMC